ncbi:MAG: putative urease accessory protein [Aeromicrobium sp.]|nr:putative urease accessory protein [Aeromicrobium sp.]
MTSHLSPDLVLMLLADARLPTAGHTQSAGLEPAVADGLRAVDVPHYIALRLRTVTRVEAATAVVALHHFRQGLPLADVETAWAARTPSPALRATSRTMARALLRVVRRLWPEHPSVRSLPPRVSRSVVLAAVADACGLAPVALARLVGYDDVQTVASAALKLLPLDPADVSAWVLDALEAVGLLAIEVGPLISPDSIPASGAPQIEVWAESHASATRRLFSA